MSDTDAESWAALIEGNARQARKRVAADVLVRDRDGRVLIVDPTYKDGWDLPGGMVEANESPSRAASREVCEELGLSLTVGALLLVEWAAPHGPWDDLVAMIFDGGVLSPDEIAHLRIDDDELRDLRFVDAADARLMLRRPVDDRLTRALDALTRGSTAYLERDR